MKMNDAFLKILSGVTVVVLLVGCYNDTAKNPQVAEVEPQVTPEPTPEPVSPAKEKLIADPIVEEAIRKSLKKPEGKLTEADLGKVEMIIFSPNTQITNEGLKDLVKLQKLDSLYLDFTKITDESLKEVSRLQQLTHLGLSNTQITDSCLDQVVKLQQLEKLFLMRTKISDAGLKQLAELQQLEWIYLSDTQVTKAGFAELKKALPNCAVQ